jgi:hypothetical protein
MGMSDTTGKRAGSETGTFEKLVAAEFDEGV